ncbi:MAG: YdcF family protein [Caulobacterales bacterium]
MRTIVALLVLLLIWTAGLLAFAARVERSTPADDPPQADGIVALTGGSDQRIITATQLLEQGKGKRLLISGVSRQVRRPELQSVIGANKPLYDCCVDLGFTASNTLGNARETADWARAKGYRKLILVTADYHMPRARLELKAAMPEADIAPYPVVTANLDAARWWKTGDGARRMVLEYSKYLAILAREAILSLGPAAEPAAHATGVKPA